MNVYFVMWVDNTKKFIFSILAYAVSILEKIIPSWKGNTPQDHPKSIFLGFIVRSLLTKRERAKLYYGQRHGKFDGFDDWYIDCEHLIDKAEAARKSDN